MSTENNKNTSWRSIETSQRYIEAVSAAEQREVRITKEHYHDTNFYALTPDLTGKVGL